MSAKTEVLRRIADALGPDPAPVEVPRDYAVDGATGVDVLDRFVERVEDYRATVHRVAADDVNTAVADIIGEAVTGRPARVVVAHDLPDGIVPEGVDTRVDGPDAPLSTDALDGADAVVTTSAVGIAETGTIVLDGGPGQGRRAITLVPDLHVILIRADQIEATVPLAVRGLDATRPQTWISGPSATSDIELNRVEGVHGPRTLHVILVR